MLDDLEIIEVGVERLDELAPLWKALHRHHISVGSGLGAMRMEDESWECRREKYRGFFNDEGTFVLLASHNGNPVGYAFVAMRGNSCTYITPDKVAELKTLSVLEDYRSKGVGHALMQKMFEILRERGISDLEIGVIITNERAIKFYERYGFKLKYVLMWGHVPEQREI